MDTNQILARTAESAERFDDMADYMKQIVISQKKLNQEERNSLSLAYKNIVTSRRASWRFLTAYLSEQKLKLSSSKPLDSKDSKETVKHHISLIDPLKLKIETELNEICSSVLDLILKTLIPNCGEPDGEALVFYHKLAADYFRYESEFLSGDSRQESASKAYDHYMEASNIASEWFGATDPLRLGLALNFSVFYYEVLNSPKRACVLAQKAFDEAAPDLDTLDNETYHESKLILRLLRDNLGYWGKEAGKDNEVLANPEPQLSEDTS